MQAVAKTQMGLPRVVVMSVQQQKPLAPPQSASVLQDFPKLPVVPQGSQQPSDRHIDPSGQLPSAPQVCNPGTVQVCCVCWQVPFWQVRPALQGVPLVQQGWSSAPQ